MDKKSLRKIAVLTSGGDAPGMNAAIRAIVRAGLYHGLEVIGFKHGYSGIIENKTIDLDNDSVTNIIQRGGTILCAGRSKEFLDPLVREKVAKALTTLDIDVLFVIGGNGSLQGAHALNEIWEGQVIGLPGTIDNDLSGTDHTIGFFTAVDTALGAIDNIRDTANAIDRIFIIEVMGRRAGFIAQSVGIGGGADEILMPEKPFSIDKVTQRIERAKLKGKGSYIMVVAEGIFDGGATALAKEIKKKGHECRECVLGHTQRGGSPVAMDRILATRLGVFALEAALEGAEDVMAGIIDNRLTLTSLKETYESKKPIDEYLCAIQQKVTI